MFKSDIWWAVLDLLNSKAYMEFLNNNKNMTVMSCILQMIYPLRRNEHNKTNNTVLKMTIDNTLM